MRWMLPQVFIDKKGVKSATKLGSRGNHVIADSLNGRQMGKCFGRCHFAASGSAVPPLHRNLRYLSCRSVTSAPEQQLTHSDIIAYSITSSTRRRIDCGTVTPSASEINDHLVAADRCEVDRARQALRLHGLLSRPREDVFAAIIRCTADRRRVDKRTRSKWSRVLRYVKMQKDEKEPLTGFIKRKGGINECTIRYGRCLRRLAARRRSIGAFQRRAAFLRG
jgi:hypothetical protein